MENKSTRIKSDILYSTFSIRFNSKEPNAKLVSEFLKHPKLTELKVKKREFGIAFRQAAQKQQFNE